MRTVAVLNRKGGVGKTTIALNLARSLQLRGNEVVIVDTDPQGSARDWAATADADTPMTVGVDRPVVHKELPKLPGYDYAVIDGVAKMQQMGVSAIKAADLVLIPVQPSALDVWTAGELIDLVEERRQIAGSPEAALVVSRAIVGTNMAEEADEALGTYGLPVWPGTHQRIAYAKAVSKGLSVLDLDKGSKASQEISALTDRTIDVLKPTTQPNE